MTAPVTPTTRQLRDNIANQITGRLGVSSALLPKSFISVLSAALAAAMVVLYKYANFIFLQLFVKHASDKFMTINGRSTSPLREWGRLVGVPDPKSAQPTTLEVDVTTSNVGEILRSNTQLINPDTGVVYAVSGDVELSDPVTTVAITAVGDQQGGNGAGTIGNMPDGATVSFVNPLSGINQQATVTGTAVTGSDAEATDAYRQRILDRFQKRPQGGAYADYEQWGEEAAGVLNIYPYTSSCPGQVAVYVESSTEPDGIPTPAQLTAAYDSIQLDESGLATRRPVGALVQTFPISRSVFDVRVIGVSVPGDLGAVRDQIKEGITAYLLDREPFIEGLSVGIRKDTITQSALSGTVNNIVSAAGGVFTSVTLYSSGAPLTLYRLGMGEKAKLGELTYV